MQQQSRKRIQSFYIDAHRAYPVGHARVARSRRTCLRILAQKRALLRD